MAQRIEYIDAMRGFTMILVVLSHIIIFSFGNEGSGYSSSFNSFFILFRMPLFFFISGFLFYKDSYSQSCNEYIPIIKKKFMIQIVSTLIFMVLYSYLFDYNFWIDGFFYNSYKLGYWFTIVLFEYFIIFLILSYFDVFIGKRIFTNTYSLIIFALFLRILSSYKFLEYVGFNEEIANFFSINQLKYFIFFSLGTIVKRYFDEFIRIIQNKYISSIILSSFFLLSLVFIKENRFNSLITEQIGIVFIGILGILAIFSVFYVYKNQFQNNTFVGKSLQFIGKRTLDIYLLHYFFIPRNLQSISTQLNLTSNPSIEFLVAIILSVYIIMLCLIISSIIRTSPILAHLMFGVK